MIHIKVRSLKKRILEFRDEVKCKVNINGINKDIIYVMNSEEVGQKMIKEIIQMNI